ncbi:MAG: hypothetical protein H6742_17435 [Alphaproteobacteria bacterium]|nr:hypothetical protein [Alphaproteobacteria bacterium]
MLLPLVILGLACTDGSDPTFGSGGSASSTDGGGDEDSGGGDDGGAYDGVSPQITSMTAEFYSPPNLARVIEVYVWWEDPQDDVDGGKVVLSVESSSGDSLDTTLAIEGPEARLDDGVDGSPVWFWLSGEGGGAIDNSQSYELTVKLKDTAGNLSDPASITVE